MKIKKILSTFISTFHRSVKDSLGRGRKAAGDLIPWNICEQFGDKDFPKLSGARIVRIATHPSYQRVGNCYPCLSLDRLSYGWWRFFNIEIIS